MMTFTNPRSVAVLLLLFFLGFRSTLFSPPAAAHIYRWDNGELITDRDAVPGAHLSHMDLAYADLSGANLTDAYFRNSNLTDADFSGAVVTGADFANTIGPGITVAQLYSTASYQSGDLSGIGLGWNDLSGGDFAGKNLTGASFYGATMTDADLSGAVVTGVDFTGTTFIGFTAGQLYSTASYQSGELSGIGLGTNDLSGWDFAGKNLTDANFFMAFLRDADFSGTVVTGADFKNTTGSSITAGQLYSTASYQSGDLSGIGLGFNDVSRWDLAGKNLTDADFWRATLTAADLSGANLTDADFGHATLTAADLSGAVVTGANFSKTTASGFTAAQLYSTASYQSGDLSGIGLGRNDLSGWNFAGKNLTDVYFGHATLTAADLSGAVVTGANFGETTDSGFTAAQLYSTASYQSGDLSGIGLGLNDLSTWDFAGKNLTGASFNWATMTDADLSLCDLRGADMRASNFYSAASRRGAILPYGLIEGLALDASERLVVRDYDGEVAIPITVESVMSLDPAAALRMVFDDDDWGSTISFQPGITVSLGGTLELLFADDVRPMDLVGTTFDLFAWEGAVRSGEFDRIVPEPGSVWDTESLYTTGEVTLVWAVPEPSTLGLLGVGAVVLLAGVIRSRRGRRRTFATSAEPDSKGAAMKQRKHPRSVVVLLCLSLLGLQRTVSPPPAAAHIYRWDNGALITDRDPVPGADFSEMDLAYADLVGANLTDADFDEATLTAADLSEAVVTGADFEQTTGRGFTAVQLYSTASYQSGDLSGIGLSDNNLSGWDLAGKNLAGADFEEATLTDADFGGAVVTGAEFTWTTDKGFTAAQLYSTASYQSGDLGGILLGSNNLSGWDFAGKNLTDASFGGATLTAADLSGAVVTGANFIWTTDRGFTAAQLYSTASYQSGDLSGIGLARNDLSGWDFAGKNLTDASFRYSTLTAADLSGANLTGANFHEATLTDADLRGANLTDAGFDEAYLKDADLSGANLTGAIFDEATLTDADLRGANLTDAGFDEATLTDADLSGAVVTGADFAGTEGFTAAQLYSTASYQSGELSGIGLDGNDLSGWDFAGKNLTDASFWDATLTAADLSFADLRGAYIGSSQISSAASNEGAILPDGRIEGLALDAAERLVVRDYERRWAPPISIPITVESGMSLDPQSTLRMVFEDDDWGSTISFEPGIAVSLGGTLELLFADDVRPVDLIGTTFDLFDWDGAVRIGEFDPIVPEPGTLWDTESLYTTGEVTLVWAVPEPSTLVLLGIGAVVLLASVSRSRRGRRRTFATSAEPDSKGAVMKQRKNPRSVVVLLCLSLLGLQRTLFAPPAAAHIYRWDNGALITDRDAVPGANLKEMDLAYADLAGANLTDADFEETRLTAADLNGAVVTGADFEDTTRRGFTAAQLYSTASHQGGDLSGIGLGSNDLSGWDFAGKNLTDAYFGYGTLTAADFSGAVVTSAGFNDTTAGGFTAAQLYSTASYQSGDLSGIGLGGNDLSGWDLAGKNLTDAYFGWATLTDADLSGAAVTGADFSRFLGTGGITAAQLYSTASYQGGDLSGIGLHGNDLSGWDLAGKNLTDADLSANLTDVDLSGAVVTGAQFNFTTSTGFTAAQLYSTASYQSGDLSGIGLYSNDLSGWDFAGKNLTGANFGGATLTAADLSGANLTDATLLRARLTDADLSGAVVTGAHFGGTTERGFTAAQLYSTASYQSGDLSRIGLSSDDLSEWDFAGKNLTDANFGGATLTDADLSGANLTDASFYMATLTDADLSGAVVTGASFGDTTGFSAAQLYSTASYQSGDLSRIGLTRNDLSGWDLAGKNLTDASFVGATLTDADLSGAVVSGAQFNVTTRSGFSAAQLYSTASYQGGDLSGIGLYGNDLSGWDFAGKNLTDASFTRATLTDADLSLGNLRGADISPGQIFSAASSQGAILPDGRIEGLALDAAERLVVHDYNGDVAIPITVESAMSLDPESTLRMVFEDDDWGSTISFEPGITVSLAGTLELLFADDVRPVDLIGTTFDLFDWDGAVRIGEFDPIVPEPGTLWDTESLYTTGEVTLVWAVPEPSTLALLGVGVVIVMVGALRSRKRLGSC